MIFALLMVAFVLAALLAATRSRFGIAKPAWILFALGGIGAVSFLLGVERLEATVVGDEALPLLPVLGGLAMLVAVLGLLALGIIWAWRRWSGSERTNT